MSRQSLTDRTVEASSGAKTWLTTALAAFTRFRRALAALVMAIALIPSAQLARATTDAYNRSMAVSAREERLEALACI